MRGMNIDVKTLLKEGAELTDRALEELIPTPETEPASIHRAMRHSTFAGGKRLRPVLAMQAGITIAGGLPKEGGIEPLRAFFPHIAKAYLIGEAAPAFAATLGEAAPYEIAGTLAAAVEHAAADAAEDEGPEAVVLLSPACASFDQFKNFERRGEAFRQAAQSIDGVEPIGGDV